MNPARVALVTASSAGLGAAIAKALACQMRVVINYHSSPERANVVLEELARIPEAKDSGYNPSQPRFHAIKADMSQKLDIQRLVSETVSKMGRLDVVVSNAGWTRLTNFHDLDDNLVEEDWDRCFNVNVKSHLFLLKAARDYLDATEGSFITIASVAGVKPSGSSLAYAVTKAAQIYLIKSLAGIVSPKIRINSVSPGMLMTDWGSQFPPERLAVAKSKTLLGRFATVDDVAEQVVCVALSKSITGTNLVVDSGFCA